MKEMKNYMITFVHFNTLLENNAATYYKAVMRITHVMNGSTEGSILVSYMKLDVCSSLTLIHERHANMADLVKFQKTVLKVIFNKLW